MTQRVLYSLPPLLAQLEEMVSRLRVSLQCLAIWLMQVDFRQTAGTITHSHNLFGSLEIHSEIKSERSHFLYVSSKFRGTL